MDTSKEKMEPRYSQKFPMRRPHIWANSGMNTVWPGIVEKWVEFFGAPSFGQTTKSRRRLVELTFFGVSFEDDAGGVGCHQGHAEGDGQPCPEAGLAEGPRNAQKTCAHHRIPNGKAKVKNDNNEVQRKTMTAKKLRICRI